MSDHNPRVDLTESIEPVSTTLVLPRFGDDELPPDDSRGLGDEEWPAQTVKRGIRLRMPTATATPRARKIEYGAITGTTPAILNCEPTTPMITPPIPPSSDKKTDS